MCPLPFRTISIAKMAQLQYESQKKNIIIDIDIGMTTPKYYICDTLDLRCGKGNRWHKNSEA